MNVSAYISGDQAPGSTTSGIGAGSVSISALDHSTIDVEVDSAALSAAIGFAAGVAASIGVSQATNTIADTVQAYVSTAAVTATNGSVELSATKDDGITAQASAAAVALGGGGIAGIAFAGGGAEATNVILGDTEAYFDNSTITALDGDVGADASATSTITAEIAAVSAAAAGGFVLGAAALGAGVAENDIGYDASGSQDTAQVEAYSTATSVTAGGAFSLNATNGATINADVAAVSAAFSAGLVGDSVAGAGVSATNEVSVATAAYIDNGSANLSDKAGSIDVEAADNSHITVDVEAASLAISVAPESVAVSVTVSTAQNTIDNSVEAYIVNAPDVRSSGATTVAATEAATITATAYAAAVSAGFVGVSGGGAGADNEITTSTQAYMASSSLVVGALSVTAQDSSTADAITKGLAASGGIISLAAAGSYTTVNVTNSVYAYIDQATIDATGDVSVTATGQPEGSATANGLSAGTLAIAGSVSTVNVNPTVRATVDGTIATGGVADYTVGSIPTFGEGGDPNFLIGAPGVGDETLVAGDVVDDGGTLYAYTNTSASKTLNLSTAAALQGDLADFTKIDYVVKSGAGDQTLNAGDTIADGTVLYTYSGPQTTIELNDDTALLALGTTTKANPNSLLSAQNLPLGASGSPTTLTAGDIVQDGSTRYVYTGLGETIDLSNDTALKADAADFTSIGYGNLTIAANAGLPSNGNAAAQAQATGSAGGIVALVGSSATATDNAIVTAGIFNWQDFANGVTNPSDNNASGTEITLAGALSLTANSNTWQEALADDVAGALIAGGAAESSANANNVTHATIGRQASITAGSVQIDAGGNDGNFAETTAGSGGVLAGAAAAPSTSDTATTTATVASGAAITVSQEPMPGQTGSGAFGISSAHTATVGTAVTAQSYGLLSGAGADATNTVKSTVETALDGKVTATAITGDATNTFDMPGNDWSGVPTNTIVGDTGGLASAAAAISTTTIWFSTEVDVQSGGDLEVVGGSGSAGALSLSAFNAFSGGQAVSLKTGGALAGAGVTATITTDPSAGGQDLAEVYIEGGATLENAVGAITLAADGTSDMNSQVNTDTYGVVTAAAGDSTIDITPDNEIIVGTSTSSTGAIIRADEADVDLFAGEGPLDSASLSYDIYTVTAYTDAYAGALIPLSSMNANAYLTQTNLVQVNTGSSVETGGSAWLEANNNVQADVFAQAKTTSWASDASNAILSLTGGNPANEFAGTANSTASGQIVVNGAIQTGLSRDVAATFNTASPADATALSVSLTMADVAFTGSISGSTLTVSAITSTSGEIEPGWTLYGTGVNSGLTILSQLTGTPGGAGTYALAGGTQSLASQTIKAGIPIAYSFSSQQESPPANPQLEAAEKYLGEAEAAADGSAASDTAITYDKQVLSALQTAFGVPAAPSASKLLTDYQNMEAQYNTDNDDYKQANGPEQASTIRSLRGAANSGELRRQRLDLARSGDAGGGNWLDSFRRRLVCVRSRAEHDLRDRRRADQRAGRPDLPLRRPDQRQGIARRADRHIRRYRKQHRRHASDRRHHHSAERGRRVREWHGDYGRECGGACVHLHLPRDHVASRGRVSERSDHNQQCRSGSDPTAVGCRDEPAGHHHQRLDQCVLREF